MTRAVFAIPGDLSTPTGGYRYARRVMEKSAAFDLTLDHLVLPGRFPNPSEAEIREALARLSAVPANTPILLDGLAGGTLPLQASMVAAPIVYLCHHPLADETGVDPVLASTLQAGEQAVLATCSRVITTSHSTAVTLASRYGVPHSKLSVAPPGTEPAARAVGSGDPWPTILSIGSFSQRKGHHLLIEALAGLSDLDWQLRIVGAVVDHAYRDEIGKMVESHGLSERVALLDPLETDALDLAYQSADIFALASVYEGFGMVFAEAVAHGLPVLGHRIGAVAEATLGTAELVPIGELQAPLRKVITSSAERQALADRSWAAAQNLTRWSDTARIIARTVKESCL
ncbi:MAG: glycosyltransferase family 4 protein [Pseudomonadota bacterium]